jgi:hypothetical protein
MQVGQDYLTSAFCKSYLQFQLTTNYQLLYIISAKYFQSEAVSSRRIVMHNLRTALLVARHVKQTSVSLKGDVIQLNRLTFFFKMTQNIDLEIKVIERYVDKVKQDRYIQLVSSIRNRQKFIDDLSHFRFFQWEKFEPIHGIKEQVILQALQKNRLLDKTCYVISENANIDTQTLKTKEAIRETLGYGMGTILVFGDADMIHFESETMNTRYISKGL